MSRGAQIRGIQRERDLARQLQADGWYVLRSAGSLGSADLVAGRVGRHTRIIEVKSTSRGPFAGFPPAERQALVEAAAISGWEPWLVWWPPRQKPQWIPVGEWPKSRA